MVDWDGTETCFRPEVHLEEGGEERRRKGKVVFAYVWYTEITFQWCILW